LDSCQCSHATFKVQGFLFGNVLICCQNVAPISVIDINSF
jgi:hypothetical protein